MLILSLIISIGITAFVPQVVFAACPTTLSLTLLNDPYLLVDSNNPASGPQVTVAYATITNTGAATAYAVYMYVGNGITPGTFAAGSDGQRLSMLGDVGDATRFIVNLAPGESKTVYWMLTHPMTDNKTYPMTIWASNADGCSASASHTFTTQKTISAAADKMLGTVTLGPPDGQVRVGNILTVTVTGFDLGVIGSNGDAWFQPAGNLDFNPDHFRLVRTEVNIHSIAGRCGYGSMPVYNRLYFPGIRTCYSFNAADYVKYYFVAVSEGTTTAKVYQQAASGAQEKYSIDYGTPGATVTFTAHCGGMLLGKSVAPQTATANTTLTWTITYRNDSGSPMGDPGSGNGLTVREDAIPGNTTYVAGSATCSGSCIIYYSTDGGLTWTTTEPVPASSVNKLKWYIYEAIPAHSSGNVSFQSKVNSGVIGTPLICNTASAGVADCPFDPVDIVCANGGADLDTITVVDDKSPCEGGNVTYAVTVNNPSTTNATGVQVTDLLPSGLTYLANSTSQGTYNKDTGLWNVGNLNASTSATLTLRASVNAGTGGTTIINWGNITHLDQIDPVLLNNSDHDGITVHAAPAAYPASNSPVCEGATIYLFGGPGGMTSYQWTGPGGFTSNLQNPTRLNATLAMAGNYTLTIIDFSGCGSAANSTSVVVNTLPSCSITAPGAVCALSTGHNASVPSAGVGATYNWNITGGTITAGNNTTQITWTAGAGASANISVTITDGNGCQCTNSALVTINAPPTCHITASPGTTACEGQTITLTEAGGDATSWLWSPDGQTTQSINVTTSGTYSVQIGDGTCTSTCDIDVTFTPCAGVSLDPASKADSLFIDADGNGQASPGDMLLYAVTVWNEGTADATGVVFTDAPDSNTTLVVGSVATTKGAVTVGNTPGDTWVQVNIGTLLAGGPASETVTISYHVTINDPLPPGVTHIYNQGVFYSNEAPPASTDDPDTTADDDSTATPLGGAGPVGPTSGVPVFPNMYIGIAAALGAGVLGYILRKKFIRSS